MERFWCVVKSDGKTKEIIVCLGISVLNCSMLQENLDWRLLTKFLILNTSIAFA